MLFFLSLLKDGAVLTVLSWLIEFPIFIPKLCLCCPDFDLSTALIFAMISSSRFFRSALKHETADDFTGESDDESESGDIKHSLDEAINHRLYHQWRGYHIMTGEIQADPEGRNAGYLDFTNDEVTAFQGCIQMDIMGFEVLFRGYKRPIFSGLQTIDWDAMSHLPVQRPNAWQCTW